MNSTSRRLFDEPVLLQERELLEGQFLVHENVHLDRGEGKVYLLLKDVADSLVRIDLCIKVVLMADHGLVFFPEGFHFGEFILPIVLKLADDFLLVLLRLLESLSQGEVILQEGGLGLLVRNFIQFHPGEDSGDCVDS